MNLTMVRGLEDYCVIGIVSSASVVHNAAVTRCSGTCWPSLLLSRICFASVLLNGYQVEDSTGLPEPVQVFDGGCLSIAFGKVIYTPSNDFYMGHVFL